MTQEMVRQLSDKDLSLVVTWAQEEIKVRGDQRKHDTIAKIKEMAGAAGISVSINNKRGRAPKGKAEMIAGKATR